MTALHQLYSGRASDANFPPLPHVFMPIFDFVCTRCDHQFEALVRGTNVTACTSCGSTELEKLLSLPNVKSESTHNLAMRAAKRRDKAQGTERMIEQRKYEESHDD